MRITSEKKIPNFITKIFFVLIYIISGTVFLNIFYSHSFWLIDNGNGGFVGLSIKENIYYFLPVIDNKYAIYAFLLFTIIFFILSLGLKLHEIKKIIFSPIFLIKKILNFFKRDKKNINTNKENFNVSPEIILPYLIKTECFCFTEQTLLPGESKIFTMVFFLDPSMDSDINLDNLKELVFTYEFSEYKS